MKRRSFLAALASLPLLGWLKPEQKGFAGWWEPSGNWRILSPKKDQASIERDLFYFVTDYRSYENNRRQNVAKCVLQSVWDETQFIPNATILFTEPPPQSVCVAGLALRTAAGFETYRIDGWLTDEQDECKMFLWYPRDKGMNFIDKGNLSKRHSPGWWGEHHQVLEDAIPSARELAKTVSEFYKV